MLRAASTAGANLNLGSLTVTSLTVNPGNLTVSAGQGLFASGTVSLPSVSVGAANTGLYSGSANQLWFSANAEYMGRMIGSFGFAQRSDRSIAWESGAAGSAADVILSRDAANTLAQRNGTNAQAFRIYNTFTDASNYERGEVAWSSNVLEFRQRSAGSGTGRALRIATTGANGLNLATADTDRWAVNGSGHFLAAADNTYDIGASGATRPRTGYFGTSLVTNGAGFGSRNVVGSYSVQSSDFTVLCSTATTGLTVLLPNPPAAGMNQYLNVKKISGDANRLTIDGNGLLIDGLATASTIATNRPSFALQFTSTAPGGSTWNIL